MRWTDDDVEKAGRILERETSTVPPALIRDMVAALLEKRRAERSIICG